MTLLPTSGIALGAEVILISNDGSESVSGNFVGMQQDIIIPLGNIVVQLSYRGGDGNDVTIRRSNLQNCNQRSHPSPSPRFQDNRSGMMLFLKPPSFRPSFTACKRPWIRSRQRRREPTAQFK